MTKNGIILFIMLLLFSCANQIEFQDVENKKETLQRGMHTGDTIRFITTNDQTITLKVKEITDYEVIGEENSINFNDISTYYSVPKEQPKRGTPTTEAWWYIGAVVLWAIILI